MTRKVPTAPPLPVASALPPFMCPLPCPFSTIVGCCWLLLARPKARDVPVRCRFVWCGV